MGVDPAALGERILRGRERWRTISCHEIADMVLADPALPEFVDTHSIALEARRVYREELQQRASLGDRYAVSLLLGQSSEDDPGGS